MATASGEEQQPDEIDLFRESKLVAGDYVVIAAYFVTVIAVGIWVSYI